MNQSILNREMRARLLNFCPARTEEFIDEVLRVLSRLCCACAGRACACACVRVRFFVWAWESLLCKAYQDPASSYFKTKNKPAGG